MMSLRKYKTSTFIAITLIIIQCFYIHASEGFDIQSLALKNPKVVNAKILVGGQPNLEDLKRLKDMGVTRIINLRTAGEFDKFDEISEVQKLNLEYFTLEVDGADGVTFENANQLDKLLASSEGKVLVHCASGNRVGALFAVRAVSMRGESIEKAIAIGKQAGLTRLEEKTKLYLKAHKEK